MKTTLRIKVDVFNTMETLEAYVKALDFAVNPSRPEMWTLYRDRDIEWLSKGIHSHNVIGYVVIDADTISIEQRIKTNEAS